MLQDPGVTHRLVQAIREGRSDAVGGHNRLMEQLGERAGAEVPALGVKSGASVDAPALTARIPELADHNTVHKLLHEDLGGGTQCREALTRLGLEGRHTDRLVGGRVPHYGAEGTHMGHLHVALTLHIADHGQCSLRHLIHRQLATLLTAEVGLQGSPGGVSRNQGSESSCHFERNGM